MAKKLSKKQRQNRKKELLRARNKSYRGITQEQDVDIEVKTEGDNSVSSVKNKTDVSSYKLPVGQIRKDLLRIILFAVFSIAFLVFLKIGNIDLNAVRGFLRF
jgi:hypothetical protein